MWFPIAVFYFCSSNRTLGADLQSVWAMDLLTRVSYSWVCFEHHLTFPFSLETFELLLICKCFFWCGFWFLFVCLFGISFLWFLLFLVWEWPVKPDLLVLQECTSSSLEWEWSSSSSRYDQLVYRYTNLPTDPFKWYDIGKTVLI